MARLRFALCGLLVSLTVAASSAASPPKCPDTSRVLSGTPFCDPAEAGDRFPEIDGCPSPEARRMRQCPAEWMVGEWYLYESGMLAPRLEDIDATKGEIAARREPSSSGERRHGLLTQMSDAWLRGHICYLSTAIATELGQRVPKWRPFRRYAPDAVHDAEAALSSARGDVRALCP